MSDETKKSTPEELATTKVVVGVFLFMLGFYEHSWLGHNHGADDTFYICASWAMWVVGSCFVAYGIAKIISLGGSDGKH